MQESIEYKKEKDYERFYTRDVSLKRNAEDREQFLKSEAQRHNKRVKARDELLKSISMEHNQKTEMSRLRKIDNMQNVERERKKKQEAQDFYLKKQFLKNAFNQEASITAQSMIHQQKIGSQVEEQNSVFLSRTAQVLKTKKPEEILLQVRTKKIEELNKYKEAPSEKKFKDI